MGKQQSKIISYVSTLHNSAESGTSPVYRAASHPEELVTNFLQQDHIETCFHGFKNTASKMGGQQFIGVRNKNQDGTLGKFEWMTYKEVYDISLAIGSELMHTNIVPAKHYPDENENARDLRILGLYSTNRAEWFVLEKAASAFAITIVPVYETLGEEAIKFVFRQTAMECCMVSSHTAEKLSKICQDTQLKQIITIDQLSPEIEAVFQNNSISIHQYSKLIQSGQTRLIPAKPGHIDSINSIYYTSGTTGMPKGVLLSERMLVSTVSGCLRGLFGQKEHSISCVDCHISYLPLAHVFERCICTVMVFVGGKIGVFSGDTLKLLDDIQQLNPSILISVPRLYNRINDRVTTTVMQKSKTAQYLFQSGLSNKIANLRKTAETKHAIWDTLLFNKTKILLGKNMRYMVSGGAPLEAAVQEKMSCMFCVPLIEGYGMTETTGATFCTSIHDCLKGHVGGPFPSFEFRLRSVPDMNYHISSNPPAGELQIRGDGITKGYFLNKEETSSILENGWLSTGDIAVLMVGGAIKLVDRKKNIFKLSQGEYVCPERIEMQYSLCTCLNQIFVYGHPSKNFLVAIVVVDPDFANRYAGKNVDLPNLCSDPKFQGTVMKEMEHQGSSLKGFEKVKAIHLEWDPFSQENDLLTPTFKLKRQKAFQKYETIIEKLYNVS